MTGLLFWRFMHFTGFTLLLAGVVATALLVLAGTRHRAAGVIADIGGTLAIISGVYMAISRSLFSQPWLHIKLTLVVALLVVHIVLRVRMRKGNRAGAAGFLAGAVILAIGILYLVIFQPLRA